MSTYHPIPKKERARKTYRELDPIKEGHRRWRYVTIHRGAIPLYGKAAKHPDCQLLINGKVIAEIRGGWLIYRAGYAFNGCSPKRYVGWPPFGMWVGTPDFKSSILASLAHDILFQFSFLLKFTMEEVNDNFFHWLEDNGASDFVRDTYHGAVDMLGGGFWGKVDNTLTVKWL